MVERADRTIRSSTGVGGDPTEAATRPGARATAEYLGDADTAAPDSDFDLLLRQVAAAPSWKFGHEGTIPKGEIIGKGYEILAKIGHGGMGVVYRARDSKLDRDVALKLHLGATTSVAVRRLIREARAMAQLSHPNIVRVFDVGEYRGQVFIAMEYLDGGSLGRWLSKATRTWAEVVDIFVQAGHGLAAAHAVGLVHRDFKPDNVLLDGQGRALVADFGLATNDSESSSDLSSGLSGPSDENLGDRLTATGGAVGTPAYMAPEQFASSELTGAADQFSFCVALYEALYGQRPYAASTPAAQMTEATLGRIQTPPEDSDVPTWLWRTVSRGLAPDPKQRFASMQALVSVLERRGRSRWRLPALAGLAAVALGVVLRPSEPEVACGGGPALFATAYDGSDRASIEQAFAATSVANAAALLEQVQHGLERFESDWLTMYARTCEATFVNETQSAEVFDRRMSCLRRRLDAFGGLVAVLGTADEEVIKSGRRLVDELPSTEQCAEDEALPKAFPLPADPDLRVRIAALRRGLAEVNAELNAGRLVAARPLIDRIVDDARGVDWAPVQIEVEATHAKVFKNERRTEEAAQAYERALWAAVEIGHRSFVARTALQLGSMLALQLRRPDDAEPILRLAQAHVQYSTDPAYAAKLEHTRGYMAYLAGDHVKAKGHFTREVELARALDSDNPEIIEALKNLAVAESTLGNYVRAREHLEEALRQHRERNAGDRLQLASIQSSLGIQYGMQRRPTEATPHLEQALEIVESVVPPSSLVLVEPLTDLGRSYSAEGRSDQAHAALKRARALLESNGRDSEARYASVLLTIAEIDSGTLRCRDHDRSLERVLSLTEDIEGTEDLVVRTLAVQANCLRLQGRNSEGESVARRMVEVSNRQRPDSLAPAYETLADVLLAAERPVEALEAADAGLLVFASARLAHETIASKLHRLRGEALHDLGRTDEAIAALGLAVHLMPEESFRWTGLAFRLGEFLSETGQLEEARRWFDQAEPRMRAEPDEYVGRLRQLEQWRREHP